MTRRRSRRPSRWHERARDRATDAAAVLLTAGLLPLLAPTGALAIGEPVPAAAAAQPPAPADSAADSSATGRQGHLELQPDPRGGPPLFAPLGAFSPLGQP